MSGTATGRVRSWHADVGWGVLDSDETPSGCWVHFSAFHGDAIADRGPGAYAVSGGFHSLIAGETVDFDWEPVTDQDGYTFRATAVRPHRATEPWRIRSQEASGGFATWLDIDIVDGTAHRSSTGVVAIDSPRWLVEIAESLMGYLRTAATVRTPWTHLSDVGITCAGDRFTLAFRWDLDEPAAARTYLVPVAPMRADPILGSDRVITRLDLVLGTDHWQDRTFPAGPGQAILMSE